MSKPVPFTEIWRGDFLECVHNGHAVVMDSTGEIVASWGDADAVILPRSSCKMLQALPLIETGAAREYGLTSEQLALACASHQGAPEHTERATAWLSALGLGEDDLRCGPQPPGDLATRHAMIKSGGSPCQIHNNCSGKHCGFLTVSKYLKAGPEYVDPAHPVQIRIREVFEDMTGMPSPGFAIDGCSAPNFATTVAGLARAMAKMADPDGLGGARGDAARQLNDAMRQHPSLVAGTTRACTELMEAMNNKTVIKTGAEGVYVAILPDQKIGVALKVIDGATRASESAMAAILVRLGVLDPNHPAAIKRLRPRILNRRKQDTGHVEPSSTLYEDGKLFG